MGKEWFVAQAAIGQLVTCAGPYVDEADATEEWSRLQKGDPNGTYLVLLHGPPTGALLDVPPTEERGPGHGATVVKQKGRKK